MFHIGLLFLHLILVLDVMMKPVYRIEIEYPFIQLRVSCKNGA